MTDAQLTDKRARLRKAAQDYQTALSWYQENLDNPNAEQDCDEAAAAFKREIAYREMDIISDLLNEIDELHEHLKVVEPVGGDELDHLIWGLQREGFHARTLAALVELRERRKSDAECRSADSLHDQLSRLATHSAEESAQMAEWDRPAPKSALRQQAEKIADDVQELIKRLPDADQGGA
ncbi:TPA: hypothetical protein ACIIU4_004386 [Citrobacter freundii]|uniref:hypothetical protein n=1 Tax=Citrobacter freundii TaxID=546 RepID=UPI000A53BD56|nr:hypothetical protein [Citrobacter freundii]MDU1753070.1 hypothetical protein [Citrobacter sp.]MDU4810170.1 hypothetical protein [Citrobacter freundii]